MKSIQQANIDDAIRHMDEAKSRKDQVAFDEAKASLQYTLEAIKNADRTTYDKYVHLIEARME